MERDRFYLTDDEREHYVQLANAWYFKRTTPNVSLEAFQRNWNWAQINLQLNIKLTPQERADLLVCSELLEKTFKMIE